MTIEEEDEKDCIEYLKKETLLCGYTVNEQEVFKDGFISGRRTLREKIKADPTRDKLFPPINTTGGQGSGPI